MLLLFAAVVVATAEKSVVVFWVVSARSTSK